MVKSSLDIERRQARSSIQAPWPLRIERCLSAREFEWQTPVMAAQ